MRKTLARCECGNTFYQTARWPGEKCPECAINLRSVKRYEQAGLTPPTQER